jgi:NADH-quinone oxidoreductase subunit L
VPAGSPLQPFRTLLLQRYYLKYAYDRIGQGGVYAIARASDFFDRFVIDGTVHGFERVFADLSQRLRRIQSGVVSDYAAYVVAGLVGFLVLVLFVAPAVASWWGVP